MKITRQKHAKKHLGFFRNNFGVREPYQILLDGTFCQAALRGRIQLREQLPRYLMGETQLCTTRWARRGQGGGAGAGDCGRGLRCEHSWCKTPRPRGVDDKCRRPGRCSEISIVGSCAVPCEYQVSLAWRIRTSVWQSGRPGFESWSHSYQLCDFVQVS